MRKIYFIDSADIDYVSVRQYALNAFGSLERPSSGLASKLAVAARRNAEDEYDISTDPLAHRLMNFMLRGAVALGWGEFIDLKEMNVTPGNPQSWNRVFQNRRKAFKILSIEEIKELIAMQIKHYFGRRGVAPQATCSSIDGKEVVVPMMIDWNREPYGLHWKPPILYRREEEGPFTEAVAKKKVAKYEHGSIKKEVLKMKGRLKWMVYHNVYSVWDSNGEIVDVKTEEKDGKVYPACFGITEEGRYFHTFEPSDMLRWFTVLPLPFIPVAWNKPGGNKRAFIRYFTPDDEGPAVLAGIDDPHFRMIEGGAAVVSSNATWGITPNINSVYAMPTAPGFRTKSLAARLGSDREVVTSWICRVHPWVGSMRKPRQDPDTGEWLEGSACTVMVRTGAFEGDQEILTECGKLSGEPFIPRTRTTGAHLVTELELTYPTVRDKDGIERPRSLTGPGAKEAYDPFQWQKLALDRFSINMSGMVEACTGAGKTRFCIDAIKAAIKEESDFSMAELGVDSRLTISIVVPTIALLEQWRKELEELLASELAAGEIDGISIQGGGKKEKLTQINIFTLKTASVLIRPPEVGGIFAEEDGEKVRVTDQEGRDEFAEQFSDEYKELLGYYRESSPGIQKFVPGKFPEHLASSVIDFNCRYSAHFLIVDEAHRTTAKTFRRIYEAARNYTLLVSATFPQDVDKYMQLEEQTTSGMLSVYRYPHALKKGNISKFKLHLCRFNLGNEEREVYDQISQLIADLLKSLTNRMASEDPQIRQIMNETGASILTILKQRGGPEPFEAQMARTLGGARARISWASGNRLACALYLIEEALKENKTIIVFHKSVEGANALYKLLYNRGWGNLPKDKETGATFPKSKRIEDLEMEIEDQKIQYKKEKRKLDTLKRERKEIDTKSGTKTPPPSKEIKQNQEVLEIKQEIEGLEEGLKPLMDVWEASQKGDHLKDGEDVIGVYHSKLPSAFNARYLQAFKDKKIRCLISVQALLEGIDVPHCDVGIAVASDQSTIKIVQALGRVLRVSKGVPEKDYYYISALDTKDQVVESKFADTLKDTDGRWIIPSDLSGPTEGVCPHIEDDQIAALKEEAGLPALVKIDDFVQRMLNRTQLNDTPIICSHCRSSVDLSVAERVPFDPESLTEPGREDYNRVLGATIDDETGEVLDADGVPIPQELQDWFQTNSPSYICPSCDQSFIPGAVSTVGDQSRRVHISHPSWIYGEEQEGPVERGPGMLVRRLPPGVD